MPYNLLREKWIPVRRRDNTREWIRPCDVTSQMENNPVICLDSDRADFNGALIQFLIALLQTCAAPDDDDDLRKKPWEDRYVHPPNPEELQQMFMQYECAFNLDGEYPRFMQDATAEGGMKWELYKLLIDGFGASDHFSKYHDMKAISYATAAVAVISHQWNTTNSASGAKAQHRSSLRNGGFLTTVLVATEPENLDDKPIPLLWRTLWSNVLPQAILNGYCGNPEKTELRNIFPWMGATRKSDSNGRDTFRDDEHPLTMFWATPRRIHLCCDNDEIGVCSIQPNETENLVTSFDIEPFGFNYKDWLHPLTPVKFDEKNAPSGYCKTDAAGVRYNHWLGIVQKLQYPKGGYMLPSKNVQFFKEIREPRSGLRAEFSIAGFGFANDNAKIQSYRYGEIPFIHIGESMRSTFEDIVESIIQGASGCVKKLDFSCGAIVGIRSYKDKDNRLQWISNPQKKNKDSGVLASIEADFWNRTEQPFYRLLQSLAAALEVNADRHGKEVQTVLKTWRKIMADEAMNLFDLLAESTAPDHQDMRSIVRARLELRWYVYGTSKRDELTSILQLTE